MYFCSFPWCPFTYWRLRFLLFALQISEAYQVLSNEELRKQYDKYGKERAVPDSGFGKEILNAAILPLFEVLRLPKVVFTNFGAL